MNDTFLASKTTHFKNTRLLYNYDYGKLYLHQKMIICKLRTHQRVFISSKKFHSETPISKKDTWEKKKAKSRTFIKSF